MAEQQVARMAVVRGEGIGPEVIDVALSIMRAACQTSCVEVEVDMAPELTTRDEDGLVIDSAFRETYSRWFAAGVPVLHGPAGGRFVYDLRREFELNVKVTPVIPRPSIRDAALVQPERLDDVDIRIVRDNSGGLYQGQFGRSDDGSNAFHEARYHREQVEVVIREAVRLSGKRDGR